MKELELSAIEDLVYIYTRVYKEGLTADITEKARSVYNGLIPGTTLLSKEVIEAMLRLFPAAYPNMDPDRKLPTKKEIEDIIKKLTKRKQELRS